jgi:protocatechuate 3,4-dioxygenase beta subunit
VRKTLCPKTWGRLVWKWIGTAAAYLTVASAVAVGANLATLTGKVTDGTGKPIQHATVMVYHAGVKNGYSTLCPSCYADCGKRTFTDAAGTYTFTNLHSDLWFELLVVRDGYRPVSVNKVDPSNGPPTTAVLNIRSAVDDPRRMVRGRVVDERGNPLRDVAVEPQGFAKNRGAYYGTFPGLDPLAVTNDRGEFEVTYAKPTPKMLLLVEARSMAPKFVVMSTGSKRQTVAVSEGAVIRGRLVADGKPVGGAEIGLIARERGGFGSSLDIDGNRYGEMRVGTQEDGSFAITNVPSPVEWYVYGKMESLGSRGATEPVISATTRDKEQVDVGDIQLKQGHRLRGQVILSDGKPIPNGMRMLINSNRAWDTQTAILRFDGHFEFVGLAVGGYSISPAVKGYSLPDRALEVPVSIDRDLDSWTIVLTPAGRVPTHR